MPRRRFKDLLKSAEPVFIGQLSIFMRILALEPYYGGSHRAFLDGWISRSAHDWTVLSLPPNKWKWRMRHSAVTFSNELHERCDNGETWDIIFCSDMLNLAEFLGLAPRSVRNLPVLAYFHENQLSYPVEHESEFDYHFAITNMTTALAATRVWFNSRFNRDSFLKELKAFLKRMPDCRHLTCIDDIHRKSDIRYPCVNSFPARPAGKQDKPIHILWAARWEYDKRPERFFKALDMLTNKGIDFRISVIGGDGGREPLPIFAEAKRHFADRIENWGYLPSHKSYETVLLSADIAVSTADHEFFGIGMIEAAAAGAYPLVPNRLAYPEVFGSEDIFFYSGDEASLAVRLVELATRYNKGDLWKGNSNRGREIARQYLWDSHINEWDKELAERI